MKKQLFKTEGIDTSMQTFMITNGKSSCQSLRFNSIFLFLALTIYQQANAQTGNWNGSATVTTTTSSDVGIGTSGPDGKTEIFIGCTPKNGLVITKEEDCPTPYLDVPMGLNAELVSQSPSTGEATFTKPFNFNVGSTLPISLIGGVYSSPIPNNPLIWARTKDIYSSGPASGTLYSSTRFVVMPDGKVGFNVYNPRATLDVRNMNPGYNLPAAIFGVNEYTTVSGPAGNKQYKTRHIQIVPRCNENGFNQITKADDLGIFFTNGKGADGANQTKATGGSGLVIAPWAASNNPNVGGIRMDADGNVEIHGKTKATQINVEAMWWSDFVFADEYTTMSLPELEIFIKANNHLPCIPSEKEVLANGINIADMLALQLQKIEELTLYTIDQDKKLIEQQNQINLLIVQQAELLKQVDQLIKK